MIRILLISLAVISSTIFFSQIEKAEKLMEELRYNDAINYLNGKVEKKGADADLEYHAMLGLAYVKLGEYTQSLHHYNRIVYADTSYQLNIEDWLNITQANLRVGRLEEARISFKRTCLFQCEEPVINQETEEYYRAIGFGAVNGESADFHPYMVDDKFYFISDRQQMSYEMRSSDWTGESYSSVYMYDGETCSQVNKPFHTQFYLGSFSYTNNEKEIYFTRNKLNLGKRHLTEVCWSSLKENGKWSKPAPIFKENEEVAFSDAHPIYIESKKMLVFSSNRDGGYGGADLYYSLLNNGVWTEPVNFGGVVNGLGNELYPYYSAIYPDKLFFASSSHLGFGGLDLYTVDLNGEEITSLNLLPRAINSSADDFGLFYTDVGKGFVASNRNDGKGKDDIYEFELAESVNVSGVLVNNDGQVLPNKSLLIFSSQRNYSDSVITNENGYFEFKKLPYEKVYLTPSSSDGAEMFLRNQDDFVERDREKNIILQTSEARHVDSVALASGENLILVLESLNEMQDRCVMYEDGEKVVKVAFLVKDKDGNYLDRVRTDENGCLLLKKLYDNGEFLQLEEEMANDLQMRFVSSDSEIMVLSDTSRMILKFGENCVEYESGEAVSDFTFLVKDADGKVVDTLTTNREGCFKLRKLYDSDTYLDIPDELSESMGIRIVNKDKNPKWEWQKERGKIVLRTKENCIVFAGGEPVAGKDLTLKSKEGEKLEEVITNEKGCFKLKKLYDPDTYFELEEEDVVFQGRLESKDLVVLEKVKSSSNSSLIGEVKSMGAKEVSFGGMKLFLLSENGIIQQSVLVNDDDRFEFKKLAEDQDLYIAMEEDNEMILKAKSIVIEGKVTNAQSYSVLPTVYLLDENNEKFESSALDQEGAFRIEFTQSDYEVANEEKSSKVFEDLAERKENITIVQNIYFANGKWDLNLEAEKVLDELVLILKKHSDLRVDIKAHTDANGSASSNLKLSENRANAVIEYLSKRNIPKSQYSSKGYGESSLINRCKDGVECSQEEHAENRRIEFGFVWK